MCLRSDDYDDDVSDDSGEYYEGGVSFDDSELYEELLPRIKAAVQRHPERTTQSIMTTARDHGMDSSSSDDGDSEADEMDTLHFKLRNAVATANGGGRPRAATRGNARFAAAFVTLTTAMGRRGCSSRLPPFGLLPSCTCGALRVQLPPLWRLFAPAFHVY